jgi:predicted DNA-binding ribbon-helix-helix protein
LEPEFIETLNKIATSQNTSVASIISSIDTTRTPDTNLSSAVRVWVLKWVISHK